MERFRTKLNPDRNLTLVETENVLKNPLYFTILALLNNTEFTSDNNILIN